ncbi:segregation and condensation protein A [Micromonospora musae]|uniref:segregation and condensation protein A n=1 Tax=Micromonospora musae TaxID=1894970 RepID=UPI0033D7EDAF
MTAPPLDQPAAPEQPPSGSTARPGDAASGAPRDRLSGEAEPPESVPGPSTEPEGGSSGESGGFTVRLANFTGPFDLLLQLIGKHKLDVTEVALHQVTDEFIAYIRAMGDQWDLDEASEFLLIAATLLDLKAARLLPAADVEDEEDLALLEARDLLFARLLQYKAFKEAAAHIADLEAVGGRRYPRAVSLEPRYAEALPELVLGIGAERLRTLVIRAMTPKPTPEVSIAHVHMVRVSVREHAAIISDRLRRAGIATFSTLCADCEATLEVVARFLALLELYREGLVAFVQEQALDELTVRWTGPADGGPDLQIDEYAGTPAEPDATATAPAPATAPAEPDATATAPAPATAPAESGAPAAAPAGVAAPATTSPEANALAAASAEAGAPAAAPAEAGDPEAGPTGSRDVGTSED